MHLLTLSAHEFMFQDPGRADTLESGLDRQPGPALLSCASLSNRFPMTASMLKVLRPFILRISRQFLTFSLRGLAFPIRQGAEGPSAGIALPRESELPILKMGLLCRVQGLLRIYRHRLTLFASAQSDFEGMDEISSFYAMNGKLDKFIV